MIKLTYFLRRLPALTQPQFLDYWYNRHRQLVVKHAPALRIRRYMQLTPVDFELSISMQRARQAPDRFDGVAEAWFDSLEDLDAARQEPGVSTAGRELIEDERRFIDLANSPIWYNEERVIIEGANNALGQSRAAAERR